MFVGHLSDSEISRDRYWSDVTSEMQCPRVPYPRYSFSNNTRTHKRTHIHSYKCFLLCVIPLIWSDTIHRQTACFSKRCLLTFGFIRAIVKQYICDHNIWNKSIKKLLFTNEGRLCSLWPYRTSWNPLPVSDVTNHIWRYAFSIPRPVWYMLYCYVCKHYKRHFL